MFCFLDDNKIIPGKKKKDNFGTRLKKKPDFYPLPVVVCCGPGDMYSMYFLYSNTIKNDNKKQQSNIYCTDSVNTRLI